MFPSNQRGRAMSVLLFPKMKSPSPWPSGESSEAAPAGVPDEAGAATDCGEVMQQYADAFNQLFGAGYRQHMWRITQDAAREASLTEDFPLSQNPRWEDWP